jgi:hypothetical protein
MVLSYSSLIVQNATLLDYVFVEEFFIYPGFLIVFSFSSWEKLDFYH